MGRSYVASGDRRTSEAAARILRGGGNAFDAAVAAGLAASTAEPTLTGPGGGGFLLARLASGGTTLFDFFADAPRRAVGAPQMVEVTVPFGPADQVFHAGMGTAAVPGCLAGWLHVHELLGRMPLEQVVAPAVEFARGGVVLSANQAYVFGLLAPILTLTIEAAALFAPDGRLLGEGERFINAPLAESLEGLPASAESLYRGELARRIGADMGAADGLLGADDLARYRVVEREPLVFGYGGRTVLTNPGPSFGGERVRDVLGRFERAGVGRTEPGSPDHVVAMVGAMRSAHERWARPPGCDRGTTHVSVLDAEGNAAAMTTSNGEGCGYVVPGTGIMLNNMLGEDDLHPPGAAIDTPGERIASGMAPTIVLDGSRVVAALGSGGSKRIATAIARVVSEVVDFGRPLQEAIDRPRAHWDGDFAQVEPGIDTGGLDVGTPVNRWPEPNMYFGGVNAVGEDGCGADARRCGCAMVVE